MRAAVYCGTRNLYSDMVTAAKSLIHNSNVEKVFLIIEDDTFPEPLPSIVDTINVSNQSHFRCLGYYAHRDTDNIYRGRTCVCKLLTDTGVRWRNYPLESEYTAQELAKLKADGEFKVRIHGGGMGCAFIKTDVFERVKYPWYDWVNYKDEKRGMLSEDLYFCEGCRKASIPVYTDTRVNCGHMLRHVQFAD